MEHQVEEGPNFSPPVSRLGKAPTIGNSSKEQALTSGTCPGPTAGGPIKDQAKQLSPRFREPRSVHC